MQKKKKIYRELWSNWARLYQSDTVFPSRKIHSKLQLESKNTSILFTKSPFVVNFVHSCPKAFDLFVIGQPQLMTIDYILTEICQKLQGFRSLQVSHVNRQGKISQIYPYYYTKASKANNNKTSFFQTKQKVKVHVSYPFTLQTKQIKINYYFLSYFSYIH